MILLSVLRLLNCWFLGSGLRIMIVFFILGGGVKVLVGIFSVRCVL